MYKLVVVDDEKWVRRGILSKVKTLPFSWVREASSGEEAYRLIHDEEPHIVITDIKMPLMDGIALIQKVKDTMPNVCFIIVSGYAEFDYAEKALNMGVQGYLLKPISEERLVQKLKDVIAGLNLEDKHEKWHSIIEKDEHITTNCKDVIPEMCTFISRNYTSDLQVKDLAIKFSIAPNYLSTIFKSETGNTISKYIEDIRLEAACQLLRDTTCNIYTIAQSVGYKDAQYFYRVFKKVKGITPMEWRNDNQPIL